MGLLARLPAASGSMAARLTTCFGNHCNTSRERRGFVRTCLCPIPLQNFLEISARPFRNPQQGEQTVSTDELTGVQALERKHPGLPLAPGKVERREFEYVRHGTRAFILSRHVVTGQLLAPACGPTRTEADFLAHVQAVVATDPQAK